MTLIITIIAVVVAFSLYDYFQSRSWQEVTSSKRNETVFENRNKAYGAYEIRRNYDKRLVLIMLSLFVGLGGLWGANRLMRGEMEQKADTNKGTDINIVDVFNQTEPEKLPEVPQQRDQPEAPSPEQTLATQTAFVAPTPSDEDPTPNPTFVQNPDTQVGTTTQTGTEEGIFTPPGNGNIGNGTGNGIIDVPTSDEPLIYVDEPAEFPGGIGAMRKYIADNIDISYVERGSKLYLKFVVDEKGEISKVRITRSTEECPTCEEAAIQVIKSMPKWQPGKVNGKPVKSYYKLPITIVQ